MNKKTKWLIAGGLTTAFAYGAAMWAVYPENRDTLTELGRQIGIVDPLPPPPAEPATVVTAGYRAGSQSAPRYMPSMAADGCSADGASVRLAYEISIIEDEKREEILRHPRIRQDEDKYITLRRADIRDSIQKAWRADTAQVSAGPTLTPVEPAGTLTGFDFSRTTHSDALQKWLGERAEEIYQTHGIKIAIKVNLENGLHITPPQSNAARGCAPR